MESAEAGKSTNTKLDRTVDTAVELELSGRDFLHDLAWVCSRDEITEELRKHYSGGWIIDLACGSGKFALILADRLNTPTLGIDYDRDRIAYACKLASAFEMLLQRRRPVTYICADVLDKNYVRSLPQNFYGMTFSEGFIEHLRRSARDEFMKSQIGLLRPGGKLIAMVPNSEDPEQRRRSLENHPAYGDEDLLTAAEMGDYFIELGLKNVESKTIEVSLIFTVGTKP